MSPISRRTFLQAAASAAALYTTPSSLSALAPAASEPLHEFDYADVCLTSGPLKEQFDRVHASYLALDNDRLLKVYRQRAGLPAPGRDMGGWYDADGFVPGHTLGQYISGLARIGSTTGDAECHAKVHELVEDYAATLGKNDYPYASKVASTTWPCYILDKYEIGLIDAFRLSGMEQARELLSRVIYGAIPYIPDHGYDRGPNSPKQAPYDETYVLPENLFVAAEITGDKKFYEMAKTYLLDREYFDPLSRNENVLPGKHAYSHAIALSSGAKAYLVLGDEKYRRATENAWQMIETTQRYASGGWGPKETFVEPHQGKLFESLTSTEAHFETPCGSYANMKLGRYLLRFTGDARYGDGLERVVYNAILAAKDPDSDGDYPYYSGYGPEAQKLYYPKKWPCCSGTLIQGVADYVLNLYFHDSDSIYVNMFVPSEVTWKRAGHNVKLIQETQYPADDVTTLRLETGAPEQFAVNIRIPGWLHGPAQIRINGEAAHISASPGGFARIQRRWKDKDRIEVRLPQDFRVEAIDDLHPNTVAVMRGPVMYVALNPPEKLFTTPLSLPDGLKAVQGQSQTWLQHMGGQQLIFVPFYTVRNESYNTYFQRG
jgi:uncharacterized protein